MFSTTEFSKVVRVVDALIDCIPIVSTAKNVSFGIYKKYHQSHEVAKPVNTSWKDDIKVRVLSKNETDIIFFSIPILGNIGAVCKILFTSFTKDKSLRNSLDPSNKKHANEIAALYLARHPDISEQEILKILTHVAKGYLFDDRKESEIFQLILNLQHMKLSSDAVAQLLLSLTSDENGLTDKKRSLVEAVLEKCSDRLTQEQAQSIVDNLKVNTQTAVDEDNIRIEKYLRVEAGVKESMSNITPCIDGSQQLPSEGIPSHSNTTSFLKTLRVIDGLTDLIPIVSTIKNIPILFYKACHQFNQESDLTHTSWRDDVKVHVLSKDYEGTVVHLLPVFGNIHALVNILALCFFDSHKSDLKKFTDAACDEARQKERYARMGRKITSCGWGKHAQEIVKIYLARYPHVSQEELLKALVYGADRSLYLLEYPLEIFEFILESKTTVLSSVSITNLLISIIERLDFMEDTYWKGASGDKANHLINAVLKRYPESLTETQIQAILDRLEEYTLKHVTSFGSNIENLQQNELTVRQILLDAYPDIAVDSEAYSDVLSNEAVI